MEVIAYTSNNESFGCVKSEQIYTTVSTKIARYSTAPYVIDVKEVEV
jgi:hypothetical protein